MLSVLLTLVYLIIIWLFAARVINITVGSSIRESLNHKRNTNNNVIPQDNKLMAMRGSMLSNGL
jgi:hypothetical protein